MNVLRVGVLGHAQGDVVQSVAAVAFRLVQGVQQQVPAVEAERSGEEAGPQVQLGEVRLVMEIYDLAAFRQAGFVRIQPRGVGVPIQGRGDPRQRIIVQHFVPGQQTDVRGVAFRHACGNRPGGVPGGVLAKMEPSPAGEPFAPLQNVPESRTVASFGDQFDPPMGVQLASERLDAPLQLRRIQRFDRADHGQRLAGAKRASNRGKFTRAACCRIQAAWPAERSL